MFQVSRSFQAERFTEGTPPDAFSSVKPSTEHQTVVNIDIRDESMMVADHRNNPVEYDSISYRSWTFRIDIKDWQDMEEFLEILQYDRNDDKDISREVRIGAERVEMTTYRSLKDDEYEFNSDVVNDVDVGVVLSSPLIEFTIIPEPTDPIFPGIPVGEKYSPVGGSLNQVHRKRLEELIKEAVEGIGEENDLEPLLDEQIKNILDEIKYGNEVVEHVKDGDRCFEMDLNHLALSSYIHAIEWAGIAYLEITGVDVIEEENRGNYYHFAGGQNSILDELNEVAELEQMTVSKIKSMNRAERRWMAHHKTGNVLPSEVKAVRDRLSSMIDSLFTNQH